MPETARAETPEARHLRLRIERLKGLASEKAEQDSKGPASEQKLIGDAGLPSRTSQVDSKTEDDGDSDEKDKDGKTGQPDKRNSGGAGMVPPAPPAPKIPVKKGEVPVSAPPAATGPAAPAKPGTAQPALVFPGK